MPDATITSTASTFGTITGTFAADQSTITGTVTGIVAGTLDGSVGVPGAGVPAGGLEGQILLKASDASFDTVWADNFANAVKATVRNQSGATMTKGTVVYISGASGNKAVVSKASASTEASSSKTFAILEEDIPTNQNGTAITMGLLKGIDTSAFTPGANLWLSTTPGQITQTPPASPAHAVFLGNAVRIHANQGEIEVRIANGYELAELHDVLLDDPANGQVLKYDAAQGLWINGSPVSGVAWGEITGDITAQGDLTSALSAKYDASNPDGYQTAAQVTSALAPYLLSSTASATYQTQAAMSAYLTTSAAAAGYYPLTGNPSAFLTAASLSGYATQAWVDAQGYLQAGALTGYALESWVTAGFYPLASNPAGYLTAVPAGYATESWVTSQGYITSSALSPYLLSSTAASTYYPLTNPSGYITSSALTGYATESWVTSQGYLTSASLTGYATESWVTAGFYPLTGNPSGFLTSSSLTGYATESWVTSLGYLTDAPYDGSLYARKDGAWEIVSYPADYITNVQSPLSVTAGDLSIDLSAYALTSGTSFTGVVSFNGSSGVAAKSIGQFKSYTSGFESTDYSLQYDTGFQVVQSGTTVARLAASGLLLPSGGITFSDATTQTTAGITAAAVAATYAPLASPALTGNPTAPTPATADNDTSIATTAFVKAQGYLTTAPVTSVAGKTGAVTLAVADVSGAAPLASPSLTGTPTAPTASAGTSTTQIATTAFVQQEVPAASTSTAGKVELATSDEAILGSSTTLVPSAFATKAAVMSSDWSPVYRFGFTATTSGTGAACTLGFTNTMYQMPSSGVASGHSYARTFGLSQIDQITNIWGDDGNIYVNFAKRIWISGRCLINLPTQANYLCRVSFGKAEATGVGDLSQRGIGWKYTCGTSQVVQLMVHNGTTLTLVNSSFTPSGVPFSWDIVSAGDGNVTLYINGSSVATTSSGPSTRATSGQCLYQEEAVLTATSTNSYTRFYCARGAIYVQR